MSVTTIIFSRDRPAQLDLCLRSIEQHASQTLAPILVLHKPSDLDYGDGYATCIREHPEACFEIETDFRADTLSLLDVAEEHVTFVMDDDVFYRPLDGLEPDPETLLGNAPGLLCVSLRLGENTTYCYPHDRPQGLPRFIEDEDALVWDWRAGDADFGYPGSLDGHVFRTADVHAMVADAGFDNPNTLEDALVRGCAHLLAPRMACYRESRLVGVPVNRVAQSHWGNRYGDEHFESERILNADYLAGRRLDLLSVRPSEVDGAHREFPLTFVPVFAA